VILGLSIVILIECKKNDPESCKGKNWRREIKLAIDESASEIDLDPISISVEVIGNLRFVDDKNNEHFIESWGLHANNILVICSSVKVVVLKHLGILISAECSEE